MTRLLVALLASALVAGCSGGIGGTGSRAEGIGTRAEGGIGGTGMRAETDVTLFGVITAFGSIWVNGVEVQYDASTPVALNGASELAIGHTVLVQARALGGSAARATSIRVADAAVGRVAASDGALLVNGQRVRIDAATLLGPGVSATPKSGETLRVSGFATADGTIVATRVERAPAGASTPRDQINAADLKSGHFVVEGYVNGVTRSEVRIGAVTFTSESSAALARDQLVRVSGRNDNGRLVVERAERVSSALPPRGDRPSGGRPGAGDRGDRPDRGGSDRPDRPDRPDRGGSGGGDRPDRPDRSGRH